MLHALADTHDCVHLRLLRKNPFLMVMETSVARARFIKLHHVTPLSHEAARIMVVKYPLILNRYAWSRDGIIFFVPRFSNSSGHPD